MCISILWRVVEAIPKFIETITQEVVRTGNNLSAPLRLHCMPGPLKRPGIASLTHTLDRPPLLLAAHSPALTSFSIIVWLSSPRNSSTISSISVSSSLLVSSVQSSMRSMISSAFTFNSARLCSRVFFMVFTFTLNGSHFVLYYPTLATKLGCTL